jgi:protein-tyrosine phosphatase
MNKMTKLFSKEPSINEEISRHKAEKAMFVDIHCHCLPSLDDGPRTKYEALALCQMLVDDGVTTAIATPHQLGQFDGCNEAPEVRASVSMLNKELETHNIPLTILPGGDVRVDERIYQLIEADKILTLTDGRKYILLELPSGILIDIEPLLLELAHLGIYGIISHPERHLILNKQYNIIPKWLEIPSYLQITAGSLLGEFGLRAKKAALNFLSLGWVSIVATDCHNLNRRKPRMTAAFNYIHEKFGYKTAHLVCIENPLRVLEGRNITRVLSKEKREHIHAQRMSDNIRR